RQERRQADSEVSGELVEADCETALAGADEVYLHDDGHRPGEALIDAEQHIRGDDPFPGRCPHDQERHRQADPPPQDKRLLATPGVGKLPDTRFVSALTTPKLMMKDVTAAVEASWKVSLPIIGTSVRSSPTMPPTKALISTSNENCRQFSRSPSAMR